MTFKVSNGNLNLPKTYLPTYLCDSSDSSDSFDSSDSSHSSDSSDRVKKKIRRRKKLKNQIVAKLKN